MTLLRTRAVTRPILAIALVTATLSLAYAHGSGEWIQRGGYRNAAGELCCGERDCAPYPHRGSTGELAYEVQIKGKWYKIDRDSVVGEFSPDGQVHVCCLDGCEAYERPQIRCVILPGHGT